MEELAIRREGSPAALTHTLRDAVAPVFRKRRLASLIFVGIFLGAVLGGLLVPRKYEAEMKILVNRDRVDAVVTPDPDAPVAAAPVAVVSEEDMNSEVELLRSRDVLEKVALACGLDSKRETAWDRIGDVMRGTKPTGERRLARSVETLERQLVIEPLKKTTLIRVAYASSDPQLSARVLETLATFYQEKHAAVHRPAGTFDFFDQQTTRYLGELQAAEARLEQFDGEEGVVSPAAEKQLALEQVSQFEAELQQDQANAYGAERRAQALEAEAAALPQRQTTQTTEQDNGELLAQLKNTLLSLELKRSEMLAKYAPSYPPVQQVEAQITEARNAVAQAEDSPLQEVTTDRAPAQDWMATELAKAEADRAGFEAQAAATARVVRHYEETARQLDEKGAAQDDLVRQVKTAEDNYQLYLGKREEARISDALDSKRIVNVSVAEAATVPVFPTLQLGWLLLGGFFTAGIASVGAAYAADRLDPSFRTPQELGEYLNVQVLAAIPKGMTVRETHEPNF
ncbi:MAG: GumC family protein [Candidatus Acidiferrales bacterium]